MHLGAAENDCKKAVKKWDAKAEVQTTLADQVWRV